MANKITFSLGKEEITNQDLIGTVSSVSGSISYTTSLVAEDSTVIIESKVKSINLGSSASQLGHSGIPNRPIGSQIKSKQAVEVDPEVIAIEVICKQEIVDALVKYKNSIDAHKASKNG